MNKIAILDASTLGEVPNISNFSKLGKVHSFETTSAKETVSHIGDANIIITNKVVIDRNVMNACPNLELICISATGTNNVDLEHAKSKNIPVKNAVGYSSHSVAQQTFAFLFHLYNQLSYYDGYAKAGKYAESPIFTHYGPQITELNGKTFGIVGLGNIGKTVANIARSFGAKVIYYSTSGKNLNQDYESVSLEELLQRADIISIHAPLNNQTQNLIGENQLRSMKDAAILINVGRGGIVNEKDLAIAINENRISGACLDVFEQEPINKDNPLLSVKYPEKLVLSPHNAWASIEARSRLVDIVYENIVSYLNSKT